MSPSDIEISFRENNSIVSTLHVNVNEIGSKYQKDALSKLYIDRVKTDIYNNTRNVN